MKTTNWAKYLMHLIRRDDAVLSDVAARAGTTQPTLSRYLTGRVDRPSVEILRAMLLAWPRADAVDLVAAHLHDEISRAGLLSDEIVVTAAGRAHAPADIDIILDRLRKVASSPAVKQLLADLAVVLDGERRLQLAAESSAKYATRKGGK